jgi:hypothetical protein
LLVDTVLAKTLTPPSPLRGAGTLSRFKAREREKSGQSLAS